MLVQKLISAPKSFTLGVKVDFFLKTFQICPQVLINAETFMGFVY
jgi:hypothetical protein